MTPLEVATGYSVFANGGFKVEPYLVHHIRDRHDEILYKASPLTASNKKAISFSSIQASSIDTSLLDAPETTTPEEPLLDEPALTTGSSIATTSDQTSSQIDAVKPIIVELEGRPATQVMDERVAYIMYSVMRDVVNRGTGRRALTLGRKDLAGKTGTTNGPTDAWFSGFNDHTVTTTWVGFDNNSKLGRREYGGIAALPIWINYMRTALKGVPDTIRPQPNGIVTIRVNADTGRRAQLSDPNGIYELFLEENALAELQNGGSTSDDNTVAPEDLF